MKTDHSPVRSMATCPVCLVRHQTDIHDATLSLHAYMRSRLDRVLLPVTPGPRGDKILTTIETIGTVPKKKFSSPWPGNGPKPKKEKTSPCSSRHAVEPRITV